MRTTTPPRCWRSCRSNRRAAGACPAPDAPASPADRRGDRGEPPRRERPPARRRTRHRVAVTSGGVSDAFGRACVARGLPKEQRRAARAPASCRRTARAAAPAARVRGVGVRRCSLHSRCSSSSRSTCSRCNTPSPSITSPSSAHRRAEVRTAAREVATLSAPESVVEAARRLGMVPGAVRRLHRRTRGRAARDGTRSHDEHTR